MRSVEYNASQMGIHKRTLHRMLREKGKIFQRELEAIRYELAGSLPVHGAATLNGAAEKRGYPKPPHIAGVQALLRNNS